VNILAAVLLGNRAVTERYPGPERAATAAAGSEPPGTEPPDSGPAAN